MMREREEENKGKMEEVNSKQELTGSKVID